MPIDTEWNSEMDFPLAQAWSLSRSQRSPRISCISNCISYDSVPQICILRNGFLSGEQNSLLDFLLHGCWTNQINIYSPKGGSVKPFFGTFCSVAIFCIFRMPIDTERNSEMDFPLKQIWSLSRSRKSPNISCVSDCIKKLSLRSANLYFVQCIFNWRTEFATGFLPLHGCWTNKINIYSPKDGSVKPFFGTFCSVAFFASFGCPLTRNRIPKWIFLWHKSKTCLDLKGHQRSAAYVIALRSYDSCILRNGSLSGERNSLVDSAFAWMLN